MPSLQKLRQRTERFIPLTGFHFDRPLVLFQSDDWGRVGLRDQEGFEELCDAGIDLGERPYDLYTLETSDDLGALVSLLKQHQDSTGRHPCLQMNFIVGNLDFSQMAAVGYHNIRFLPLAEGFPAGWSRSGLLQAYREGITGDLLYPALHGATHFCRQAVEKNLVEGTERAQLLKKLWRAGTPYIHWRMPWIGYEYWDPERPEQERFLSAQKQSDLIGQAVGGFAKLFSTLPRSACAPGYRADDNTHRAWAQHGICVAQSGPGALIPPHFDRHGVLHVCRTIEFEPATDASCNVDRSVRQAERCFEFGLPAIVSVHSINFHSTVRDFRTRTLAMFDEFLNALESRHGDLLYIHDEDLYEIVRTGTSKMPTGRINVVQKKFVKSRVKRMQA